MKRERKEKRQGQQEESLLEKQLLQLRRMKTIPFRKGKRQWQKGEPEGLLEKQLLQSLRIDHRGERKHSLGPQKLRL